MRQSCPRLVITRAPLRISFVGGGSDLPSGRHNEIGTTVSTAIDKHVYCMAKWRYDKKVIVNWRDREEVDNSADLNHELIRESLLDNGIFEGIEISTFADVPGVGSGLGSSAATTCAVCCAITKLKGYDLLKMDLAEAACDVEIRRLKRHCGRQDQYASAIGGQLHIEYNARHGTVAKLRDLKLTDLDRFRLSEYFLLFSPREKKGRNSDDILSHRTNSSDFYVDCCENVDRFLRMLSAKQYEDCGKMVAEHHILKSREFSHYMPDELRHCSNDMKLCGAGGTGHLLVCEHPLRHRDTIRTFENVWGPRLPWFPATYGTQVIHAE